MAQGSFLALLGLLTTPVFVWFAVITAAHGLPLVSIPLGILALACVTLVVGPVAYFFGASVRISPDEVIKSWPFGLRTRACRRDDVWVDSYQMDIGGQLFSLPYTINRFHGHGGRKAFSLGSNWWPIDDIIFASNISVSLRNRA